MRVILLLLAILAACFLAYVFIRARAGSRSTPKPYNDVRGDVINRVTSEDGLLPPPTRPDGLDMRLPASDLHAFKALWPPTESNRKEYFAQYSKITESIDRELSAISPDYPWIDLLPPRRQLVYIVDRFEAEVNNGGFDQFFLNTSGDAAALLPDALRTLNLPELASMAERANAQFPDGPSRDRSERLTQMDNLPESASEVWNELSAAFYDLDIPFGGIGEHFGGKYILDHPEDFFLPR